MPATIRNIAYDGCDLMEIHIRDGYERQPLIYCAVTTVGTATGRLCIRSYKHDPRCCCDTPTKHDPDTKKSDQACKSGWYRSRTQPQGSG